MRDRRLRTIQAEYDAVKVTKHRHQPSPERKGEGGIYNMLRRLKGCNLGRDLERNYTPARGILHQFRVNVVGHLGKLQVNIEGGEESAAWFNQVWAKDCDFRDDVHWSTQLQNVVASVLREGDLLALVDDDVLEDSGKLIHWESDQIAPLSEAAFKKIKDPFKDTKQDNGILRNELGRIVGYISTGKRGKTVIDEIKDVTIWPRGVARLVKNPWRLNQGRGVPSMVTSATNFVDLYEILSKELQSAKLAASMAGYTKRANATTNWDDPASEPEFLPENVGKTEAEVNAEAANSTDSAAPNYENFESMAGGFWEYIDPQDDIQFADIKRPNVHLAEFIDAVLGMAGASMGLAKAYTILHADTSYTAFRGDMILTWVTFIAMQKWLERTYADWVARKVLAWAMGKEHIKALPAGWEQKLSWQWPIMPHVDELKEENATKQALKNGTTDYSALLGPDWAGRMEGFAKQIEKARELGLPLSIFEMSSGGAADAEEAEPEGDEGNDAKNNGDTGEDGGEVDVAEIKGAMDAYGGGVRAGALTPQQPDEAHFRKALGLPALEKDVKDAWASDGGVRRPVTLKSQKLVEAEEDTAGAGEGE